MIAVLLPPSEAKRTEGDGPTLTELGPVPGPFGVHRLRVAKAVARLSAGRPSRAAAALLLPDRVADTALATNRAVLSSPTCAALDRYAGVVYDGLDARTLSPAERAMADDGVWIFSGLLGVVTGGEAVPDYRVPAAATLPRLGVVSTSWRPVLTKVLPARLADRFVLDLRSGDYTALWRAGDDAVAGRVLTRRPDGTRSVVSYNSKLAKGRLTRQLMRTIARGERVDSVEPVVSAWAAIGGHDVEVRTTAGRTLLDLIE